MAARPRWTPGADRACAPQRRDFTIDGSSVDAEGVVHDHVGLVYDIAARCVRFIGDPDQRIAEDYLRILRFFRMHASYGKGEPDRAGISPASPAADWRASRRNACAWRC